MMTGHLLNSLKVYDNENSCIDPSHEVHRTAFFRRLIRYP